MLKTQIVEATYENGILRPLQELEDLPEQSPDPTVTGFTPDNGFCLMLITVRSLIFEG